MKIGRYELLDVIGEGGNATVWRARSDSGRLLAFKIIRPNAEIDDMERFQRERRLLDELGGEEKGFVPLLDAGSCAQGPYIVMPLLEKKTLRDVLNEKGPLPVGEALDLVSCLAATIALAHAHGVVHRDLKPGNVLFSAKGRPLVADLGLGKHLRSGAPATTASLSITRSHEGHGTPLYMAPEQMVDFKHAGPAADVFALGVILYECLTGNHARERADPRDPTSVVTRTRIDRRDVPLGVKRVVERALAEDPAARYADAGELLRALHISGIESSKTRRPPWIAAVPVAGLVLVGALVVLSMRKPPPREVVVAPPPPPPTQPSLSDPAVLLSKSLAAGWRALDEQRGSDAESAAKAGLRIAPRSAEAAVLLGASYVAQGKPSTGLPLLDEGIEHGATHARAYAWRGRAHFERGEWDQAIDDSDRAIGSDPGIAWAWSNRGQARAHKGELALAERDASAAIERDDTMTQSYLDRARIRLAREDFVGAEKDASEVIRRRPDNVAFAWVVRAKARKEQGDVHGARADAERAHELDSKNYPSASAVLERKLRFP